MNTRRDRFVIAKHFVTVGTRRVHYLRAGSGPALALLHASACSSKVMRPLIEVFAREHTVLAFDTPGFGLSDPLPLPQPSIADFADALAATLDALGIGPVACYGRHTGASIGVEFAVRHPQRCAMVLTDGYAMLSGEYDDARIADYLKPIVPSWDGTHLVWLWFRYRDQHVFWPWNAQSLDRRADADVPDAQFIHRGVVEFLEAGDNYRLGYAAAFRYNAIEALQRLEVPVCFGTRPGDWMHRMAHLVPSTAWREVIAREPSVAADDELRLLRRHKAAGIVPRSPPCAPVAGRVTLDFIRVDRANLLVRKGVPKAGAWGDAPPIFVLPHAPGSSAPYEPLLEALAAQRAVVSIDYFGHGESDARAGNPHEVAHWADTALAAMNALGVGQAHLYGHMSGAAVAVELARHAPERVASLVLDAPIALDPIEAEGLANDYAPDITPVWDGSHLLKLWHHLRDSELWFPWFDRRHQNNRKTPPRIDPVRLTALARDAMKHPESYHQAWASALLYPFTERLAMVTRPYTVIAADADTFAHTVHDAIPVDDTSESRARVILEWIATCEAR